jgi:uncharacterized protein YegL
MRKLPVYFLIDVSGSMRGEPIEAIKVGLHTFRKAICQEPLALEMCFLSVVTFASVAKLAVPLTEVSRFLPPELEASGGTALGEALKLVTQRAQKEVRISTPERKGDYKPVVFILTDGAPTDDVDSGLREFRSYKWGIVVACAAGPDADVAVLQKIAGPNVLSMANADSNSYKSFFGFVTTSIAASSKKVDAGSQPGCLNELPPPPPEIALVKI